MSEIHAYPCDVHDCGCNRCEKTLSVVDEPYEREDGQYVYPAFCNWLSPPEPYEIPAEDFEAYLRNFTVSSKTPPKSIAKTREDKPNRKYQKSTVKGWTQNDAAKLLGISARQLRNYSKKPPDKDWPGWEDPIKLKIWLNAHEGTARLAKAIKHHLPFREGGVTERGMLGSTVPARKN